MSLHEVLPYFAETPEGFAVTDEKGEIVGQITAAKVLATLASGEDRARETAA